ncbi:MAG: hypothetical protein BGO09_11760 [Bacteroidetes bacterium 47-18]|nr:MAG: hypothetical protein BGO09_11760 [Bacteroidetes bacterium 47-18]
MSNDTDNKIPWFDNRNKSRLYKLFLVCSILAFIASVLYLVVSYRYVGGIRAIAMPLAPLIFAYFIYMYASRLKQLK